VIGSRKKGILGFHMYAATSFYTSFSRGAICDRLYNVSHHIQNADAWAYLQRQPPSTSPPFSPPNARTSRHVLQRHPSFADVSPYDAFREDDRLEGRTRPPPQRRDLGFVLGRERTGGHEREIPQRRKVAQRGGRVDEEFLCGGDMGVSEHPKTRPSEKGTCMGRVSYEDDGVQRFESREPRRDLGDERCGGADVKRHDGESPERARREQQGIEGQGGVAGVEGHRDALDRAAADKVGGDVWGGEDGAEVFEAGQGLGREREGVHGVEAPETDLDEVVLRLEEAGEEGLAAHRGGEHPEREGASLEDPREIGGVVAGGELEAEVGEVGEALEGAVEEAEKVGGEDVVGPLEVEAADERRIDVVPREGLHEAQRPLGGDVDQRTVQHARGDLVHDGARREHRDEVAPRNVSENELERLWRQHRKWAQ
jgi:hypothetical protein